MRLNVIPTFPRDSFNGPEADEEIFRLLKSVNHRGPWNTSINCACVGESSHLRRRISGNEKWILQLGRVRIHILEWYTWESKTKRKRFFKSERVAWKNWKLLADFFFSRWQVASFEFFKSLFFCWIREPVQAVIDPNKYSILLFNVVVKTKSFFFFF